MKKIKRVFAWISLIVIIATIVISCIRALTGAGKDELMFWIYVDVAIPVFIYVAFLVTKLVRKYVIGEEGQDSEE